MTACCLARAVEDQGANHFVWRCRVRSAQRTALIPLRDHSVKGGRLGGRCTKDLKVLSTVPILNFSKQLANIAQVLGLGGAEGGACYVIPVKVLRELVVGIKDGGAMANRATEKLNITISRWQELVRGRAILSDHVDGAFLARCCLQV